MQDFKTHEDRIIKHLSGNQTENKDGPRQPNYVESQKLTGRWASSTPPYHYFKRDDTRVRAIGDFDAHYKRPMSHRVCAYALLTTFAIGLCYLIACAIMFELSIPQVYWSQSENKCVKVMDIRYTCNHLPVEYELVHVK